MALTVTILLCIDAMKNNLKITQVLSDGGIIVYPTEGVYGLGCDPFNETAVRRLLKIKQRNIDKGLILVASSWDQVQDLVKIDLEKCDTIKCDDSCPTTWVFPATKKVPVWITGKFNTVAIRVTSHPGAKKICQDFGGPIVSTSANLAKQPPISSLKQLDKQLKDSVDFVVGGRVGSLKKPTQILDIKTRKIIRS